MSKFKPGKALSNKLRIVNAQVEKIRNMIISSSAHGATTAALHTQDLAPDVVERIRTEVKEKFGVTKLRYSAGGMFSDTWIDLEWGAK